MRAGLMYGLRVGGPVPFTSADGGTLFAVDHRFTCVHRTEQSDVATNLDANSAALSGLDAPAVTLAQRDSRARESDEGRRTRAVTATRIPLVAPHWPIISAVNGRVRAHSHGGIATSSRESVPRSPNTARSKDQQASAPSQSRGIVDRACVWQSRHLRV